MKSPIGVLAGCCANVIRTASSPLVSLRSFQESPQYDKLNAQFKLLNPRMIKRYRQFAPIIPEVGGGSLAGRNPYVQPVKPRVAYI